MAFLKDIAVSTAFAAYNLVAPRLPVTFHLPPDPLRALKEYFDAIWVLTIPRNLTRQETIRKQLHGLDFEFVNGVDGTSLQDGDVRIDLKAAEDLYGRRVRINELACTMSHLSMFRTIVEQNLRRVLVLEDDAAFLPTARKWIAYCLERLPEDWEIFYLGYRFGELRGFQREILELVGRNPGPPGTYSRSVGRGIRTAAQHDFTHAYAVTNSGAAKFLEGAYPVFYTADGWLAHRISLGDVKGYISVPKLLAQRSETGSSIHGQGSDGK